MNPATTTPTGPSRRREDRRAAGAPRSLGAMVLDASWMHTGTALQSGQDKLSYREFGTAVSEIAAGLIALGIEPGDRIAILGATSATWTLADYGSLCAGAVVAGIYHTNSAEECEYVLAHSGSRLVFCEDAAQAAKVARVRDRCPDLRHVVLFDGSGESDELTLAQLRQSGVGAPASTVEERLAAIGPDDLATLVYTSGTTGPPKGCALTHANLLATTRMYIEQLGLNETHSLYQFLPLAHVLARVAQAVVLRAGARACFWGGDPRRIVDELAEFSPTHFPAVPRIYEKVHGVIVGRVTDGPAPQRALFEWALASGARRQATRRAGGQPGFLAELEYRLADRLVLSKVRGVFGNELLLGLVGAAPVARELLEFFDACGVLVLEGYGLSETCAASTLNTPDAVRFGTVGKPLPGTEVSVAADGELLLRGPHVFRGYFHDPAATAEALTDDGWLRTGDLGAIDGDGFVSITGRKKDLIITSSGKNVTPVNIESALRDSRYITEAVVYGDNRPYLVALLTLDGEEARTLAERRGISADPATLASDPRIHGEIAKEVAQVNEKFARIEQIKRFAILGRDLSQADGELTPTLKVKRAIVYTKFADIFAGLYEESTS
jgi:long-chain acyl-CoA synthetase